MPRSPNTSPQAVKLFSAMIDGANQWRHGYDLMQITGLKSGTLYPLLIRLTKSELLKSRWLEPDAERSRPRQVYRLTRSGVSFATGLFAKQSAAPRLKPLKSA